MVSTLRCGRNNPGSNPGHGRLVPLFANKIEQNSLRVKDSAIGLLKFVWGSLDLYCLLRLGLGFNVDIPQCVVCPNLACRLRSSGVRALVL